MSKGKIVLIILIIAASLYSYFGIFKEEQKVENAKEKGSVIVPFDVLQISDITISQGEDSILIQSTTDGWVLKNPVDDSCDQGFVNNFVATMQSEKSLSEVASGNDIIWSDYGLEKPKGFIEIKNNAGKSIRISVGAINNFEGNSYIRINEEDKVLLASSDWAARLDREAIDFREKSMIRQLHDGLIELRLTGAKPFHLKKENETWSLVGNKDFKVNNNKVQDIFRKLKGVKARAYVTTLNAAKGLKAQKLLLKNRDQSFEADIYKLKSGYLVASGNYIMIVEDIDFDKIMNYNIEELKETPQKG